MAAQVALKREEDDVIGYQEPSPRVLVYQTSPTTCSKGDGPPVPEPNNNQGYIVKNISNETMSFSQPAMVNIPQGEWVVKTVLVYKSSVNVCVYWLDT